MRQRVIVDENAGPGSAIWERAQKAFAGKQWDYRFLTESHPGIPDVEILNKLIEPGVIMLTADRLLCGFVFRVAGTSGVKGLRASEDYCLTTEGRQSETAGIAGRRRVRCEAIKKRVSLAWETTLLNRVM